MAGTENKDTIRIIAVCFVFLAGLLGLAFFAVERFTSVGEAVSLQAGTALEKKENSFKGTYIFLIIALFAALIAVFVVLSLTGNSRSQGAEERIREEARKAHPELMVYISSSIDGGLSASSIEQSLLRAGWKHEDIAVAFAEAIKRK